MTGDSVEHWNVLKSNFYLVIGFVTINTIVFYRHLLVSFEELLSLRLSDRFALLVGWINNNWRKAWKEPSNIGNDFVPSLGVNVQPGMTV